VSFALRADGPPDRGLRAAIRYHARTDGLVSLGVLLSASLVALGITLADPIIAIVITAVILRIAYESWQRSTVTRTDASALAIALQAIARSRIGHSR
jgi:divalent metal cation (Fe/Co/Zn/Cd) transporter